jgi:SAM-dependent methyltransferase
LKYFPPSTDPSILEIGSGNGNLLFALVEAGYSSSFISGIDYSPDATELANSIARSRGQEGITFAVCDLLTDDPPLLRHMSLLGSWDVVMDKGTLDAIALGPKDEVGQSPAARYSKRIASVLKPGGVFLITCAFGCFRYEYNSDPLVSV